MEKSVIFKNKGEIFKCNLDIEGANIEDTFVRLCLEFDDNKNMFFYGNIQEDGSCMIEIPKLPELQNKEGKLSIEVVADSTFFKVYECFVDLKNSVEVKMINKESAFTPVNASVKDTKVGLSDLIQEGQSDSASKDNQKKSLLKFNDYLKKSNKK